MIYEELKLPLPVYDRLEKQYRFSKADVINKVIVTKDRIIPFQFIIGSLIDVDDITSWTIRKGDAARTLAYTLNGKIDQLELVQTADGRTYIIFKGTDLSLLMQHGVYHMEFVINSLIYFSEQFEVRCESPMWDDIESIFSRFDFDNGDCDFGAIMYQTGYKNRVYIDTAIHKETPSIEEEGSNDGAGNFIPTLQQYIDNLNIEYVCPYYLADSLVLMSIHRNVTLTTPNTLYSGKIRNIKPTVVQEESNWLYRLTLAFQQDSKYINANCCENIALAVEAPTGCTGVVKNIVVTENVGGFVSLTWDLIGNADRVTIGWGFGNINCPMAGSIDLTAPTDLASYSFPGAFPKGTLILTITPKCLIEGQYVDGTQGVKATILNKGETCTEPVEPPVPEPGSAQVIIENNTASMPITNITGIPGFVSLIISPMSGKSGTHTPFPSGTGTIRIYFDDSLSDNKNAKVFVNGVQIACYALGSSPRTMLFLTPGTFGDADDIKITVNEGSC